jgi:hypothetical protein
MEHGRVWFRGNAQAIARMLCSGVELGMDQQSNEDRYRDALQQIAALRSSKESSAYQIGAAIGIALKALIGSGHHRLDDVSENLAKSRPK